MNEQQEIPPGPWRWTYVVPEHVPRFPHGAEPQGEALVAADQSWIISADSGFGSPEIHPAVKTLLAEAWQLPVTREVADRWQLLFQQQVEESEPELERLRAEASRLRAERDEARAWAWSEFHREYNERWLATTDAPELEGGWDWDVPAWLSDPTMPVEQVWWPSREG